MESVFGRYRNLIVLVGVLFAQILGLAVQVRRARDKDSEPTRLIRVWAVGAVTPLEKALSWVQTSSGGIWHNYFYLRGVRAENRELKQQIEQLRLQQARMIQDADQAHRLQALLGFKEQFIAQTTAAQVIGGSGSDLSRVIYLDKGYRDGVRTDMAVITEAGIVGKVLRADRATGHVAQVLLIDDQTSGVGSILEKSRLQGILRGTSSGTIELEKVMSDETVPVGEQVLTSGGDGIFPKGLTIGTVTKVSMGSDLFLNIRVRPAADLSRLEEVLIVTKVDEKQTEPDQGTPVRAADILAQRLPGVPAKPETAAARQGAATKNLTNQKPNSAATPKGTKPNLPSGPDTPNAQSTTPKSPSPPPTQIGGGAVQGSPAAGRANSGAAKVSATSAQSGTANPQPAVEKKNAPGTATGTGEGSGASAAKPPVPKPPAGSPASTGRATPGATDKAPKPVVSKPGNPDAATSKSQPATQDTPQ